MGKCPMSNGQWPNVKWPNGQWTNVKWTNVLCTYGKKFNGEMSLNRFINSINVYIGISKTFLKTNKHLGPRGYMHYARGQNAKSTLIGAYLVGERLLMDFQIFPLKTLLAD